MISTLCQSAALERIFAPWTAKIAVFLHTIVETILTIAEIVRTTLREFGTCCRKAGQRLLALRPGLSWLRITDNRKVDLDVSLSAQMREAWQASSPQLLLDRRAGKNSPPRPMVTMPGKLTHLEEPEGHDTGSEWQTSPHVKCLRGFVNPLSATQH